MSKRRPSSRQRPSKGQLRGVGPVRTCIACRKRAPAKELVRLYVSEERIALGAKPGTRGVWLCWSARCVDRLLSRREGLGRAFRVPGPVEASDLRDALRRHAAQEAIRALQKCWRSGLARSDLAPQEDPTGPGAPLRLCAADLVGDVTLDSKGALRLPLSASDLGGLLGRDPLDRLWLRAGRPSDSLRRWLRRRADLG